MVFARDDFMVSKPTLRYGLIVSFALALSWVGGSKAHADASAVSGGVALVPGQAAPPRMAGAPVAPPSSLLDRQPVASTAPARKWYGYQVMLADATSIALGFAFDRPEVAIAGYFAGPIIVHAVHRRGTLVALSPIMRLFLPLMGMAIGSQFRSCNAHGDECEIGGAIVGGSIGAFTAALVDWSIAWGRTSAPPSVRAQNQTQDGPQPGSDRPSGLALTAAGLAPTSNGLKLLLGGTF